MAEPRFDIAKMLKDASTLCAEKNERFTPLRAHIYELILQDKSAVKAYDLLDRLSPELGSPKPPTVYRALDFLSRLGLVHRVEALNAYIACGHNHADHSAEFFICETCKSVSEGHAHSHEECSPEGFLISRSVVEHYGQCAACIAAA